MGVFSMFIRSCPIVIHQNKAKELKDMIHSRNMYLLTYEPNEDKLACASAQLIRQSSLFILRNFASLAIQNTLSGDSDQTAQMRRLI